MFSPHANHTIMCRSAQQPPVPKFAALKQQSASLRSWQLRIRERIYIIVDFNPVRPKSKKQKGSFDISDNIL